MPKGAMERSSAMRAAIAAPAEWPTTIWGAKCKLLKSAASLRDIAVNDCSAGRGMEVNPWPGKSMDNTR